MEVFSGDDRRQLIVADKGRLKQGHTDDNSNNKLRHKIFLSK